MIHGAETDGRVAFDRDDRSSIERTIHNCIKAGRFVRRQYSWIAEAGDYFFKINRMTGDLRKDIVDSRSRAEGRKEFECLRLLNGLDHAVVRPIAYFDDLSCLVLGRLTGPDLLDELRWSSNTKSAQAMLEEGIAICGRLHRTPPVRLGELQRYDHDREIYRDLGQPAIDVLNRAGNSLVVYGFEIRNLKRETKNGALRFFDPHKLFVGIPEEDVSRFILSILSINWGRHANFLIWDGFDLQRLLEAYELASDRAVDLRLLSLTFEAQVAMRRHFAEQAIRSMTIALRPTASLYKLLHFGQIARWRERNGI